MQNSEKPVSPQETVAEWEQRVRKNIVAGEYAGAREMLESALESDPQDSAALALMGELYFEHGDLRQAIGHYVLAIAANAAKYQYKERFIELAGLTPFYKYNEAMKHALGECLKTRKLDCARAQILWYTLLTTHPAFKKLYKFSNVGSHTRFNTKAFDKVSDWKPLLEPFFLNGLKKIAVYHPVFEDFLTHLRLRLSESLNAEKPKFKPDELVSIAEALSHYCFYTEYVFDTTPAEDALVSNLRKTLEESEDAMKNAASVVLYACYASLYGLSCRDKLAELHGEGPLADAVQLQIRDHQALLARREAIEAITEIENGVSKKVQEQYEEFPYPRWKAYSRQIADEEAEGGLRGRKAKILVAGCGTGREAIQHAIVFADSEVLGIDLSRTSLSYAIGKAEEIGVSNVKFRQADILKLGEMNEQFDYVSSSGVLHHMDNLDGWDVLCGLVKPGGLMRIALYSETARRHIVTAHKAIAAGGFGSTASGMRKFRRASRELLDRTVMQDLMNRGDYYHLSMYRDLLFHVREFRLTIPQIAEKINSLGLEFIKFGVEPQVLALYRKMFPDEGELWKLDNWHAFEQKYPDTFSNMYHFWCRKKPD